MGDLQDFLYFFFAESRALLLAEPQTAGVEHRATERMIQITFLHVVLILIMFKRRTAEASSIGSFKGEEQVSFTSLARGRRKVAAAC